MSQFLDKNSKLKIVEYGKDAVQIRSFDTFKKRINTYLKKLKGKKKGN